MPQRPGTPALDDLPFLHFWVTVPAPLGLEADRLPHCVLAHAPHAPGPAWQVPPAPRTRRGSGHPFRCGWEAVPGPLSLAACDLVPLHLNVLTHKVGVRIALTGAVGSVTSDVGAPRQGQLAVSGTSGVRSRTRPEWR